MKRLASILAVLTTLAMTAVPLFAGTAAAAEPGNQYFNATWQRTDLPVSDLLVDRTWIWGPTGRTELLTEPYQESPGGQRTVQYFDKSRMEITHPGGDTESIWYVTNGLLVVELITGELQVGDNLFEQRSPAEVPVAGDRNDAGGPTYATFSSLLDAEATPIGEIYIERLSRSGQITTDQSLLARNVAAAHFDEVTGHSVAAPFWAFMNSSGLVYQNGQFGEAALFADPLFGTGRPISEAYWAEVLIAGTPTDVLMQCFERRCLTYNPSNDEGWQVEAGNVGIHYYEWRYEVDEDPGQNPPPAGDPDPGDPDPGDPPPGDPPGGDPPDDPPPGDPDPGDPPAGDMPVSPHNLAVEGAIGSTDGPYVLVRFQFGEGTALQQLASDAATGFEAHSHDDDDAHVERFHIYRQQGGTFNLLAEIDADQQAAQEHVYQDFDVEHGNEYCYYVTALNRYGESAPSDRVCDVVPHLPQAPQLISPLAGYTTYDREVTFEWGTVAGATGYVICVLEPAHVPTHCDANLDRDAGAALWTSGQSAANGTATFELRDFVAPDNDVTQLYWTVAACIGSAYDCGYVGEYRQIQVDLRAQLVAPVLVSEVVDPNDPRRHTFTWELVPNAERYILCVAEPGANCEYETGNYYKSGILGPTVSSNPLTIPAWLAPDGQNKNLNWTVAACDIDLNCVWQELYRSFTVYLAPEQGTGAPNLISPPDGYTTEGNHALLTWAPVDGAASYRVCIAYEIGARCPGNQVNMSAYFGPDVTSYNLWFHERTFKEFEWSVAACDENGDCVWQQNYHSLIFDRELDPPALVSAVVDQSDPGRFTFSWNLVQGAERYVLCVAEPGANCEHETGAWYKSSILGPAVDTYPMDIPLWLAPDGQVTNLNWKVAACDQYLNCSWGTGYSSIVVDRS